jgi:UDP-N-acetylmuramate dehydrogenase
VSRRAVLAGPIEERVPLARFTTIGTGGPARYLGRPRTLAELTDALALARSRDVPVATVGLGSNLLAADEGFAGLVLHLEGELAAVDVRGTTLVAGGGAPLAVCLHRARTAGLGGIEFVCAIPGTAGGAVRMNAGAYGSDVASVLARALVVAAVADEPLSAWETPATLGLEYRRSRLRHGQVVARVELELTPRAPEEIKRVVRELNAARKAAQPTDRRTFGSVFKNPAHELTAGRMLDECGLRGFTIGGARISPRHANFIENAGGATTADALALVAEARRRARERFGVVLEPEVQLLGRIAIPPLD